MARVARWLLAVGLGASLSWGVLVVFKGLSDLLESSALKDPSSDGPSGRTAIGAAVIVVLGLVGGGFARLAHLLRARRSLEKPTPPPHWSAWVFRLLAGGLLLLGACWGVRDATWLPSGVLPAVVSFAFFLVLWAGSVTCAAVATSVGAAVSGKAPHARRQGAVFGLLGAISIFALPQLRASALGDSRPFEDVIQPGPVQALGEGTRDTATSCAEGFLQAGGRFRNAYLANARRAKWKASHRIDVEQLLVDAVTRTCLLARGEPAAYFTRVVTNLIIRGNTRPGGDTCDIDPDLPAQPLDLDLKAQTARCWKLVQAAACEQNDTLVAILQLRAGGDSYPDIASALGMKTEAVKMRLSRFIDRLPSEIREQCQ